jgi:hypothetical protein
MLLKKISVKMFGFILSAFVLSTSVQAEVITVGHTDSVTTTAEEWQLTTDGFNGMRQSTMLGQEDLFFAVSESTVIDASWWSRVAPVGFHWASTAEMQLMLALPGTDSTYKYYNQGGWNGYFWEGSLRRFFIASDSLTTGFYGHAGNYQKTYATSSFTNGSNQIAGLLLIKDAVQPPAIVSAPVGLMVSTLIVMGFISRRGQKTDK